MFTFLSSLAAALNGRSLSSTQDNQSRATEHYIAYPVPSYIIPKILGLTAKIIFSYLCCFSFEFTPFTALAWFSWRKEEMDGA